MTTGPDDMNENLPFHSGEVAVQTRLGVQDRVGAFGKQLIRDHLTEEHRAFFPLLPNLLIGGRDASGCLWASMLAAEPGFISSGHPRQLDIQAMPAAGDPLRQVIRKGARIDCLGMQFETRRRNRLSGHVRETREAGFTLEVDQTFGNCPKYIQARQPGVASPSPGKALSYTTLRKEDVALINQADTFFIASGIEGSDSDPRVGNDVSHRGGRPGFVRVDGDQLVWPDFIGNFMFNTLGNITVDPRVGLLFIDFERGDTLQLTGRAEIFWDHPQQQQFQGAERFVSFRTEKVVRIPHAQPLKWVFRSASPFNARTGVWKQK